MADLKIIVRGFMNTNPESKLVWLSRELEDFCFRFCLNHMTAVTQTEAFEHLVHKKKKKFRRWRLGKIGGFGQWVETNASNICICPTDICFAA
jgi:hypothetical protein